MHTHAIDAVSKHPYEPYRWQRCPRLETRQTWRVSRWTPESPVGQQCTHPSLALPVLLQPHIVHSLTSFTAPQTKLAHARTTATHQPLHSESHSRSDSRSPSQKANATGMRSHPTQPPQRNHTQPHAATHSHTQPHAATRSHTLRHVAATCSPKPPHLAAARRHKSTPHLPPHPHTHYRHLALSSVFRPASSLPTSEASRGSNRGRGDPAGDVAGADRTPGPWRDGTLC